MTLSITSVLALFTLLALSSAVFFLARRTKIPYTVLLVAMGVLLVPLVHSPWFSPVFGFLDDMTLTTDLLFFIFLPVLIFESGFNMHYRRLLECSWTVSLLAIVSLVVSAFAIAVALWWVFPRIGIQLPFVIALVFAAIISATDPVAVLALFKEYGAPRRLTLVFEGESLFNDGTAVALFMVVLAVARDGFHGVATVGEAVLMFAEMVLVGGLFGLGLAMLFSLAIRMTRADQFVSTTLLLISAHVTFILCELINSRGLFGLQIHMSSIIATTISSLFLGNYSRHALAPRTDEYIGKAIEHLTFVVNSLVFLLAGLLFASIQVDYGALWLPIVITIAVVVLARALSVYVVTVPLNLFKVEGGVPASWQALLAWGSLRGALAIIVVQLVPADLTVPGWSHGYSVRDMLIALTISCILFTLFVKAPTIGPLIRRMHLDLPEPADAARAQSLRIFHRRAQRARFAELAARGYVDDVERGAMADAAEADLRQLAQERLALAERAPEGARQGLELIAQRLDAHYLNELFVNREIGERAYRAALSASRREDGVPGRWWRNRGLGDVDRLEMTRAQTISCRKVVDTLETLQHVDDSPDDPPVFDPQALESVTAWYRGRLDAAAQAGARIDTHQEHTAGAAHRLAGRTLHASGDRALDFLRDRGMITESDEAGFEMPSPAR